MDDSTSVHGRRLGCVRTGEAAATSNTNRVRRQPGDRPQGDLTMVASLGFTFVHGARIFLLGRALMAPSSADGEGATLAAPSASAPDWSDSYGVIEAARVAASDWVSGLSPVAEPGSAT